MIQRIQTIWLLLAAVSGFLTLNLPFYSGSQESTNLFLELTAKSDTLILILTVAVAVLALVTIFLYKNRPLQMKLTLVGIVLSLITLFRYFTETRQFAKGNYSLTAVLSFLVPIFLILAARGIYKDNKLIKSLDRLR